MRRQSQLSPISSQRSALSIWSLTQSQSPSSLVTGQCRSECQPNVWPTGKSGSRLALFLRNHQLPILHAQAPHALRQLKLLSLLDKLLLQRRIHQRHGDTQVPNLELSGIESHIAVLRSQMSRKRDVDVLAGNLREELAARNASLQLDLITLHFNFSCANYSVGRGGR